jgi:hypothetical protein
MLFIALLIAEEAIDRAGKTLGASARERFPAIETYIATHQVKDWAKLRLECARQRLGCPPLTSLWGRTLNNLQIATLLNEAFAMAFNSVQSKHRHVYGNLPAQPPDAPTDTIRLHTA